MSLRRKRRQQEHAAEIAAAQAASERARTDHRQAQARQPFLDSLIRAASRVQTGAHHQRTVVNHLGEVVAEALGEGPASK